MNIGMSRISGGLFFDGSGVHILNATVDMRIEPVNEPTAIARNGRPAMPPSHPRPSLPGPKEIGYASSDKYIKPADLHQ